ncbi:MAG: sulfoxide reductase heme-binding subunit YedZ [Burkholderiales bacterium]|nr:MAG: sulfoxide reductase heme-binding subunit YedZ [Burkholderiales bacterium]
MNRRLLHPAVRPLLFLSCCLPLFWLVAAVFLDRLGANPAEALIRSLGDWAIRALVLVLMVTPLRILTGWSALARWRRMLGLFAFFYASLHLLAYAWFDMEWLPSAVIADLVQRPFILVGMLAWLILLALALTSFDRAIRRLGAARWRALHRLVYAAAALVTVHFLWMRSGKNDYFEVWIYGGLFALLLGWRLWHAQRRRA